jgi:hypothetical protein
MGARKQAYLKFMVVMLVLLGSAALVSVPLWAAASPGVPTAMSNTVSKAQAAESYGRLPLFFIENQGQVDARVKYFTRGQGHAIFFTSEGAALNLSRSAADGKGKSSAAVQLRPQGMRPGVEIVAAEPLAGKVNYYQGSDPGKWRTNVPTYGSILYREAYPGIDLKFYGAGKQLEYDLIVKAGADPSQVKFRYQGIKSLKVTKAGDLTVTLPDGGQLVQKKPVIYQDIDGQRVSRDGKFRLLGNRGYGFQLASYDSRYPLIIDPVNLVFSTYLGGTTWESGNAIAVDLSGDAIVVGSTQSTNFPTVAAIQAAYGGGVDDAFIARFNPTGSALTFATYLGGNGDDIGMGVALDPTGDIFVTGETSSTNFPLSGAGGLTPAPFQSTLRGASNAFFTHLNNNGTLAYSTYLGGSTNGSGPGSGSDMGKVIAVDSAQNAYIAGDTSSTDFPVVNAFQGTLNGTTNVFVAKMDPHVGGAGGLLYSTYLGGAVSESVWGIAVDAADIAYLTGETESSNFPVTNASTLTGFANVFVSKLNAAAIGAASMVFSTYYGGTSVDSATGGIAVDTAGNFYIAGNTDSSDFPTVTPYQATLKGFNNAFVVKFNPAGTAVYSTYLGGSGTDIAWFIAVDAVGNVYVTGETDSTNFPIFNPFQRTIPGASSAFVSSFNSLGTGLRFSTYLGGSGQDFGFGIAVDPLRGVYVTGLSLSANFPLVKPFQSVPGSLGSAFVTKLVSSIMVPIDFILLLDD